MKLSEILGWLSKEEPTNINEETICSFYNHVLDACDREIDREALHGIIAQSKFDGDTSFEITEKVISTMPTWLRKARSE